MVYIDQSLETSNHSTISVRDFKSSQNDVDTVRRSACPCIRFNLGANQVFSYTHITDMTDSERSAAFYSNAEMIAMKQNVRYTAQWLVENKCYTTGEPDFTIRGLESRVYTSANQAKRLARRNSTAAVLLEQEMQFAEGETDPEAIAEAYAKHTYKSRIVAAALARKDAEL